MVDFRPSSADRWIPCAGSVARCRTAPKRPAGEAAREGSAAHRVAELCLTNKQEAAEYIDRGIDIEDGKGLIFLDEHDCEAIQLYIDTVRSYAAEEGAELYIEQHLSLEVFGDTEELKNELKENAGTTDAAVPNFKQRVLTIIDLKFGRGVLVMAESYQLRDYALMGIGRWSGDWDMIRIIVVQPRLPHEDDRVKIIEYTPGELMDFLWIVYGAMQAAKDPNAPLVAGEKQCRWCDGAPGCPAVQDKVINSVKTIMENAPPLGALTPSRDAPPENDPSFAVTVVRDATPDQLADWLDRREMVEGFFKAVEQRAAGMLTMIPGSVPRYKMSSRSGNRKFKEQEADKLVPLLVSTLGLKKEDLYAKPKLLGPAPIEKLLKGKDLKTLLATLVERPDGAPTLVKDSDNRAALPGVLISALPPLQ